jgi:drug/metabolite transporter, DME family
VPKTRAARLSVIVAAILFSTGGAAIKGTVLTAFQVAGLRSGVAAIAIYLLMPSARRGIRIDLLPAALAYAATLVCFVIATKLTTSAAAIFLQATAPIWVLVLSPLLLRERLRRADLPFVALAALGLVLVFLGPRDTAVTAPLPELGNTLGLAAGLFYALLMITVRRLARDGEAGDRSLAAMVLGNALAFLSCLPLALPLGDVTLHDALAIVYLGVVQIGLAYWFFARGLRSLPALEVALLVLVEPILNPLWTWLLEGEAPTALVLTGGAIMVLALAARAVLSQRN